MRPSSIWDDIVVGVVGVVGGQVRLGVRAPLAVSVHREEVRMRIGAPTAT